MSTYSELTEVMKMEFKGGDAQKYLGQLLAKIDKMPESAWEKLTENTQEWVNDAGAAFDAKEKIPIPKGMSETAESKETKETGEKAKKGKAPKAAKSKAEKGIKAAKPAKKGKRGNGIGGKRPRLFKDDQKITILAKGNPKREGSDSHKIFGLYKKGMTVRQALDAGVRTGDLKWDKDKGFIDIK